MIRPVGLTDWQGASPPISKRESQPVAYALGLGLGRIPRKVVSSNEVITVKEE